MGGLNSCAFMPGHKTHLAYERETEEGRKRGLKTVIWRSFLLLLFLHALRAGCLPRLNSFCLRPTPDPPSSMTFEGERACAMLYGPAAWRFHIPRHAPSSSLPISRQDTKMNGILRQGRKKDDELTEISMEKGEEDDSNSLRHLFDSILHFPCVAFFSVRFE